MLTDKDITWTETHGRMCGENGLLIQGEYNGRYCYSFLPERICNDAQIGKRSIQLAKEYSVLEFNVEFGHK